MLGSIAEEKHPYIGDEFAELLRKIGPDGMPIGPEVVTKPDDIATETQRWHVYRATHAGSLDSARLSLTVRDLNVTPPLDQLNIESSNAADIAKIMSDSTNTADGRAALVQALRNNYRRMPESYLPMVSRQAMMLRAPGVVAPDGKTTDYKYLPEYTPGDKVPTGYRPEQVTIYHYFPKIALDLTGELQTVASLDRFDFLAVAVTLHGSPEGVQFANFAPKTADLFDFSLGSLKQTASAQGSATVGGDVTAKATGGTTGSTVSGETTNGSSSGNELDAEAKKEGTASFTLTDELTRDLKSSLDARSAGIVKDGRTFIIELRSNDQHRVAGTYSYTVMLDVPSTVTRREFADESPALIMSIPVAYSVTADVRIIGVVRHVAKEGKTGTFKRVPEPTNDTTFDEVLVREKRILLWKLQDDGMTDVDQPRPTLIVYTNSDNATFSVVDDATHKLLMRGKGREADLVVAAKRVSVQFDPIIQSGNTPNALVAPDKSGIVIDPKSTAKIVGNYLPKGNK